jgi:Lon protease-like protein
MFPLGTVLFPHATLPLHVFEPRYRLMVRTVLEGDQTFGVVLIERGSEVGGGDTRFDVGTRARVVQAAELPDGRFALVVVGLHRLRVAAWLPDDPYPRAEIVDLEDAPPEPGDRDALAAATAEYTRVVERARRIDPRVPEPQSFAPDAHQAAYELAAAAPITPLDAQRVLSVDATRARLTLLAELLRERGDELDAILALGE